THHNRSQGRHSLLLQSSCPKHRDQGKDVRRDHCSDGYGSKKGLTTRRRYGKSHHGGKRRNVFRSACHRADQHYTRRIVTSRSRNSAPVTWKPRSASTS